MIILGHLLMSEADVWVDDGLRVRLFWQIPLILYLCARVFPLRTRMFMMPCGGGFLPLRATNGREALRMRFLPLRTTNGHEAMRRSVFVREGPLRAAKPCGGGFYH